MPKAKAIYSLLQEIKGKQILAGQESMLWDSTSVGNWTYSASSPYSFRDRYDARMNGGSYPAIYESDFGDVNATALGDRQRVVDIIKARAPKGNIFILNWHAARPDDADGNGGTAAKNTSGASVVIDSMLREGSALNVEWYKRLDVIAGYLDQLNKAGIPVLWRPFHENNGNFFWWGQQPRFKELWRQMYNYFTRVKGLDNLLWVYNSNHFDASDAWVRKNYPGDTLVDIVSVDIYSQYHGYEKTMWDTLSAIANGKPVGIAENGKMPDVRKLFSEGQDYTFFCTWFGFEDSTTNSPYGNYAADYAAAYVKDTTLTEGGFALKVVADGKKTVAATASAGGSVTASPVGRVDSGVTVTLTAKADSGYEFSGWSGDTTAAASVNPLLVKATKDWAIKAVFVPASTTNLLKQGAFDSGTAWKLNINTGTATVDYSGKNAVVAITNSDGIDWHIQFAQEGIALDSGASYTVTFDASSTVARSLKIGLSETAQWHEQSNASVNLTTATKSYSITLTSGVTTSVGVLQFNLGASSSTITLDNVKMFRNSAPTGIQATHRPLASRAAFAVSRSGEGFAWTRAQALEGTASMRVLDAQGRILARAELAAGATSGMVPTTAGSGLRWVVLEGNGVHERVLLPSMR